MMEEGLLAVGLFNLIRSSRHFNVQKFIMTFHAISGSSTISVLTRNRFAAIIPHRENQRRRGGDPFDALNGLRRAEITGDGWNYKV